MPMYILIEYSDNYSKTCGSLWQYYGDEPPLTNAGIVDFPDNSVSFKLKQKLTSQTRVNDRKTAEIMVPLKYLANFWRTLEIPLVNFEINLILTWSTNCVLPDTPNQAATFEITDTKL